MWTKKEFLAKLSKVLYWIRELLIPILENDPETVIKEKEKIRLDAIKDNCKNIAKDNLDDVLKFASQAYKDEESRRKNVESKSSILIGSLGLTISILTTVFLTMLKDFPKLTCVYPKWIIITIIACFIVLIVYLCTTIFFAIRALERKAYETLTSSEIAILSVDDNFKKKIIETLLLCTERNYYVTNRKMDNMIMAHEYFRRSIVTVFVIALLIAITLFSYKYHYLILIIFK